MSEENPRFIKVEITNESTKEKSTVGIIDKVLSKYITTRKQKHYMYIYQGFGISEKILNYLKGGAIEEVEIKFESDYCVNEDSKEFCKIYDRGCNKNCDKFKPVTKILRCKTEKFIESNLIHDDGKDMQRFVQRKDMQEEK